MEMENLEAVEMDHNYHRSNLEEGRVENREESLAGDLAESLAAKRTAPGQKLARTHSAHP
jgi:hypothetical protein